MLHKDTPILSADGIMIRMDDIQPANSLVSIYGTTSIISKRYETKTLRRIAIEAYDDHYVYCCEDQEFFVKTEDGFAYKPPQEGDTIICLLSVDLNHTMVTRNIYEIIDTAPIEFVKLNLKGDSNILINGTIIVKP